MGWGRGQKNLLVRVGWQIFFFFLMELRGLLILVTSLPVGMIWVNMDLEEENMVSVGRSLLLNERDSK
jgi:hypothetical protein